ncbi:MAG: divergent PAP2 family protein [bacterium]|jgi:acid phosphatase family membrane protein YuiD
MATFFDGLFRNKVMLVGTVGWFTAQLLKFLYAMFVKKNLDFRYFVSTGGMPSSHSSFVTSISTAVGFETGWDSAVFALALAFSIVVMYDAAGVRLAAGRQAEILNVIVDELFHEHKIAERRLRELLGHTPIEVFSGALLGVIIAVLMARPA